MDPLSLDPTRRVDRDLGSIRLLRALIYDMTSLATDVTGWLLIAAAAMLWFGWTLLPVRIGAFFHWDDFPRVRRRLHLWIWLFRIHLFGHLMAVMGLVAHDLRAHGYFLIGIVAKEFSQDSAHEVVLTLDQEVLSDGR